MNFLQESYNHGMCLAREFCEFQQHNIIHDLIMQFEYNSFIEMYFLPHYTLRRAHL